MKEVEIKITKVTPKEREMKGGKLGKGVIYFHRVGEIDGKVPKGVEPNKIFRKHLAEVLEKSGMADIKPASLAWSKTAGCSCGCSPGFIGRTSLPKSVYVDYNLVIK